MIKNKVQAKKFIRDCITYLKKIRNKTGINSAILGISGGIDSSLSSFLSSKAFGVKNVRLLYMPYRTSHGDNIRYINLLIKFLNLPRSNFIITDITPIVDGLLKVINDAGKNNIRLGNVCARARMMVIYDLAKRYNALVIGTENKTENLLGYYTRFGDEASDVEPIISLYKSEVNLVARYAGLPQEIINKIPTADLWKGQTDEQELGVSYKNIDEVLPYLLKRVSSKKINKKTKINIKIIKKINKLYWQNHYKSEVPYKFKQR